MSWDYHLIDAPPPVVRLNGMGITHSGCSCYYTKLYILRARDVDYISTGLTAEIVNNGRSIIEYHRRNGTYVGTYGKFIN